MSSLKGITARKQIGSRGKRSYGVPEVLSRALPGELWGALNVMGGIARSYVSQATSFSPQRIATRATAAANFSTGGEGTAEQEAAASGPEATLRQRLDYRPRLSAFDLAVCGTVPAAICGVLYMAIKPARLSIPYAIGMCMIYAAWVAICRAFLLERHYTMRLVSARELADKDSKFAEVEGVSVHYKVHSPPSPRAALHCYHGFGANTGSWAPVQAQMADVLGALVTSHDMPGFGLTSRPSDMKKYTLAFNGRLGRKVQDKELDALKNGPEAQEGQNAAPKRVLMGHSLGAACATAELLNSDLKDVDALILVAPAVIAFGFMAPSGRSGKTGKFGTHRNASEVGFSRRRVEADIQTQADARRSKQKNLLTLNPNLPFRLAIALTQALVALTSGFWTRLLEPFTILGLRSAVRSRKFWERGLARAWYNKDRIGPEIVDSYRLPQLVAGWEKGLVRFTSARMTGGRSIPAILKDAWKGKVKPTQAEELAQLVEDHNIKVLIVHGKNDALVPASNSRKLATLLPNSELKMMDRTGHVPHEERPDEFLAIVKGFLDKV